MTYEGAQGFTVDHVVTTEAATNGGSSGGPVVDHLGRVVGLVSGGQQWTGDAPAPVDDEHELDVTIDVDEPESGDIAQALFLHGDSINQGRYDAAWAVLSPRMQQRLGDLSSWSGGLDTSWWSTMEITAVAPYAEGRALVQATLRTRQAPEFGRDGQTCSVWAINYQMQLMNGSWLIDDVAPSTPTVC